MRAALSGCARSLSAIPNSGIYGESRSFCEGDGKRVVGIGGRARAWTSFQAEVEAVAAGAVSGMFVDVLIDLVVSLVAASSTRVSVPLSQQ